jgi:acyl carrier protein
MCEPIQLMNDKLRTLLTGVLGAPPPADPDVPRDQIAGWTSVAHLNLVLELEEAYDVRFEVEDIEGLHSLRDVENTLARLRG